MHSHFADTYTVIEQRRHALAAEVILGEDHHESIVQRGIDEAVACQDMLERPPVQPSWRVRTATRLVAAIDAFARHDPAGARWLRAAAPALRERHDIMWWPLMTSRVWW